jgi:plasmid rolling circle replication initiator protein Rep
VEARREGFVPRRQGDAAAAGEFHPHVHILLLVDRNYFNKRHDLYIDQAEWSRLWVECRGLDYTPVVDLRRVRHLSEVTKYVTKAQDYLT